MDKKKLKEKVEELLGDWWCCVGTTEVGGFKNRWDYYKDIYSKKIIKLIKNNKEKK